MERGGKLDQYLLGIMPMGERRTMGQAMPVKTATIVLDGDYDGYTATVRTNPRFGTKLDLSSGDTERFMLAVRAIVLDWNVCDEEGTAIEPPAKSASAVNDVPDDLLAQIIEKYATKTGKQAELPKA